MQTMLRNRNTLEFLGIWENLYNPNFNYGDFAIIRNQVGLNSFKISIKELFAKTGRYVGTYAHKEIAFEFDVWTSPEFKIDLVREYQRLKEEEQKDEIIIYLSDEEQTKIDALLENDNVWLTQAQFLELCQSSKSNVSKHFKHIFEEGELRDVVVVREFRTTTQHMADTEKTQG